MSEIFISHAVADTKLAKLLTNFLKEAIGVPNSAIFCSSVKGHGIPLGEDFNEYIKKEIQAPKLVMILMTPAYLESLFCLMELGAAWVKGSNSLPIVVPPVEFDLVTKTLGLKQAWKIADKSGLIDLKQTVQKVASKLETRSEHTWDEKRALWGAEIRKLLPQLQQATKVDAKAHSEVVAKLTESEKDVERLETALSDAKDQITELEKVKDKEGVRAIKKRSSKIEALQEEFDELISDVETTKPSAATVVIRHLISDHYDRAGTIDWLNYRPEFEAAVRYGLISADGDDSVEWHRGKLRAFGKALEALDTFLGSDDGEKLKASLDPSVPMEPDDLEFWERHLRLW